MTASYARCAGCGARWFGCGMAVSLAVRIHANQRLGKALKLPGGIQRGNKKGLESVTLVTDPNPRLPGSVVGECSMPGDLGTHKVTEAWSRHGIRTLSFSTWTKVWFWALLRKAINRINRLWRLSTRVRLARIERTKRRVTPAVEVESIRTIPRPEGPVESSPPTSRSTPCRG